MILLKRVERREHYYLYRKERFAQGKVVRTFMFFPTAWLQAQAKAASLKPNKES